MTEHRQPIHPFTLAAHHQMAANTVGHDRARKAMDMSMGRQPPHNEHAVDLQPQAGDHLYCTR